MRCPCAERSAWCSNFALLPHRNVIDNAAFARCGTHAPIANAPPCGFDRQAAEWAGRFPPNFPAVRQRGALRCRRSGTIVDGRAFGALDPLIRRQLQDQFLSLSRQMRNTTIFITHDLDEAIRLGTRIAIMRDGQLVQIGTPAEIVRKPADDYVADFVSGLSRLKLLQAADIMTPLAGAGSDSIETSWPRARPNSDLDRLVDLAAMHDSPIVIETDDGVAVGLVDKKALLRGIQGKPSDG
jgi:glycine betaine/proline transport system ATP-binding protein